MLKSYGLLEADETLKLPERAPQYDDEELGVSFFRTCVADVALECLTLPRTFFGRSEIRGVSFRGTDLSESTMNWNDFIEVDFTEASLERADFGARFLNGFVLWMRIYAKRICAGRHSGIVILAEQVRGCRGR